MTRDNATAEARCWWERYEEPEGPLGDLTPSEVDDLGQYLVCRYLSHAGYEVIEQNWRANVAIVARAADGTTALIDVDSRLDLDGGPGGMPRLAVNSDRARGLRSATCHYVAEHLYRGPVRCDVIAIDVAGLERARLRHLVGVCNFAGDSDF